MLDGIINSFIIVDDVKSIMIRDDKSTGDAVRKREDMAMYRMGYRGGGEHFPWMGQDRSESFFEFRLFEAMVEKGTYRATLPNIIIIDTYYSK